MNSKKYCPKCKSFDIRRTKRGFIKKVLLQVSPLYRCGKCGNIFSFKEMQKNEPIYDPRSGFDEEAE
jgi:transposase-like protein